MPTPELHTALQLELLFDPDDYICFKPDIYTRSPNPSEFFCINPLKDPEGKVELGNIAKYRNFLIEFDTGKLSAQERRYEQKLKLPYTTKTYSGGKSIHYIISLIEPVTLLEYERLNAVMHAVISTNDSSTKNANRLSRTAGIIRKDSGKVQRLLGSGERINYDGLMKQLAITATLPFSEAIRKFEAAKEKEQLRLAQPPAPKDNEAPLLGWVRYMLETGSYEGTSRHAALVRVASALNGEGYGLDRIESVLYQLQDKFAIPRNDVPGIIKFICR